MTRPIRARAVWTPAGALDDTVVLVDPTGRVERLRPAAPGDPPALDGLLVPGLVNAHTHLELSGLAGAVPGGEGLAAWVSTLMARREQADRASARQSARDLAALGTAVVCDISNAGDTGELIAGAGLAGVVQHEFIALDRARVDEQVDAVAGVRSEREGPAGPIRVRPTAHSLYSTAPALVSRTVGVAAASPASVHAGEAAAEIELLARGTGPLADLLDELGTDWRWWTPPGIGPVRQLAALGLIGPGLLVVHAVHTTAPERQLLGVSGTPVCLCVRSNLHIEGDLPDVRGLLEERVPLCLGTDSLASSPDLDVLGEIPILADAFPDLPAATWLHAATAGGARALGFPAHGRIVPGARPGLLLLAVGDPEDLARGAPDRRWILRPDGRSPERNAAYGDRPGGTGEDS